VRIILIFFIFLITNIALAKDEKVVCKGFCENQKYHLGGGRHLKYVNYVKKGKKIRRKTQIYNFYVGVKNSDCAPFMQHAFADRNSNDKLYIQYTANICVPCPKMDNSFGLKLQQGDYCNIPLYSTLKYYSKAFKDGLFPKDFFGIDLKHVVPKKDPNITTSKDNGLMFRQNHFAISNNESIIFMEYFNKDLNKYFYTFEVVEYKSFLRKSIISATKPRPLESKKFISFLKDFERMEVIFEKELWEILENAKNQKRNEPINHETVKLLYDVLYDALPNKREKELLFLNFPNIKDYHIQTRD